MYLNALRHDSTDPIKTISHRELPVTPTPIIYATKSIAQSQNPTGIQSEEKSVSFRCQEMYPEEESAAISTPTAMRMTSSRDHDDLPSSTASSGCWSCFPCLEGARERGIQLSMKLREKSELVAGPKWKTFIRRFNRSASGHHNRRQGEGRFQYDPLSYSLNFEEQNGGEEDEDAPVAGFRNFSSRFAPVHGSGKPAGEVSVYG